MAQIEMGHLCRSLQLGHRDVILIRVCCIQSAELMTFQKFHYALILQLILMLSAALSCLHMPLIE